jgi:hypothetical protein
MAGTPRKSASTGFDSGGNVTADSGQNSNPPRDSNVSGAGQSDYKRKVSGLAPDNLPLKRQPQASQSEVKS